VGEHGRAGHAVCADHPGAALQSEGKDCAKGWLKSSFQPTNAVDARKVAHLGGRQGRLCKISHDSKALLMFGSDSDGSAPSIAIQCFRIH
jgi:hypothetical protein